MDGVVCQVTAHLSWAPLSRRCFRYRRLRRLAVRQLTKARERNKNVKAMKVCAAIATMLGLVGAALALGLSPASAQRADGGSGGGYINWDCWGPFKQTDVQYARVCGDVATRPGVRLEGRGWRTFPTKSGLPMDAGTSFTIKDTMPRDGKCAWARIRLTHTPYSSKPHWYPACGKTKKYDLRVEQTGAVFGEGDGPRPAARTTVNRDDPSAVAESRKVHVKMWICRGQNPKHCKLVWNQQLGTNPYLKN